MGLAKDRIVLAARWEAWRRELEAEHRRLGMSAAEAKAEADRVWARTKARLDWLRAQFDEMMRLEDVFGEQYARFEDAHPEIDWDDPDAPEMPETPEQAELEKIEDAITAVRERDQWPAHLYWGEM